MTHLEWTIRGTPIVMGSFTATNITPVSALIQAIGKRVAGAPHCRHCHTLIRQVADPLRPAAAPAGAERAHRNTSTCGFLF